MSNGVKQSKPFVRAAKIDDCWELSETMRQEDVQEIWHHSRSNPLDALTLGYRAGNTLTVEWQGRVVAMFGHASEGGVVGVCWMLASDDLVKIKKSFIKECRQYVIEMQKNYPVIGNLVWSKNTVHIEWLKWLGFQFDPPVPIGPDGELFYPFYKVSDYV